MSIEDRIVTPPTRLLLRFLPRLKSLSSFRVNVAVVSRMSAFSPNVYANCDTMSFVDSEALGLEICHPEPETDNALAPLYLGEGPPQRPLLSQQTVRLYRLSPGYSSPLLAAFEVGGLRASQCSGWSSFHCELSLLEELLELLEQ